MDDSKSSEAAKQIRKAMTPSPVSSWLRGIIGAVIGGLIGFLIFKWLLMTQSLYAGMLPGGFIGFGFGIGSSRRIGWTAGIVCGLAGLVFGCWADGATNDPAQPLLEYLQSYSRIPRWNKIMIALGAIVSGWLAQGR